MSIIFGQLTSFSILEGRWDRMIHEHNSFALTRNSPNFFAHHRQDLYQASGSLVSLCVFKPQLATHLYIFPISVFWYLNKKGWRIFVNFCYYLSCSSFLRACAGVSLWFAGEHRESRFLRVSRKGQSHQSAEGQELESRAAFCHPCLSDGSCSLLSVLSSKKN